MVVQLPELQAERFEDIGICLEGYSSFLKLKTKEEATMQLGEHTIYEMWFKVSRV